jgi:hypothetical protein
MVPGRLTRRRLGSGGLSAASGGVDGAVGLEAHFLMAYLLEQSFEALSEGAEKPPEMDAVNVQWCKLLATVAARLDADGDQLLAQDVAAWGTKAFLIIDPYHDVPEDVVTLGEATAVFARLNPPRPASRHNPRA